MSRTQMFNDEELKKFVNDLINKFNNLKNFEASYKISYSGLDGILIYDTKDFFRIAKLFEAEIKERTWKSDDSGLEYRYSIRIRNVEFSMYTNRKEELD